MPKCGLTSTMQMVCTYNQLVYNVRQVCALQDLGWGLEENTVLSFPLRCTFKPHSTLHTVH